MSSKPIPPDILSEVVEAVRAAGGVKQAAADKLGMSVNTLKYRLGLATKAGLTGGLVGLPPLGHEVVGVSTLYNGAGETSAQWVKTRVDRTLETAKEAIEDAFSQWKGKAKLQPEPKHTEEDLLTIYNLADLHLGLYAWKNETGMDFDVDIGEAILKEAVQDLVAQAPKSEVGVLLNLGDFFHSDNNDNRTRANGNVLDVDTRYARVLQIGVALMVQVVELMLQKHSLVIVRNLPGNHDEYGSLALAVALSNWFHDDPRVEVDTSAAPFWVYQWGKVMLAAAHGDYLKPEKIIGFMAGAWPSVWGNTRYRYAYLGHVHHKARDTDEVSGAVWESFNSLTAKDAWNRKMGFLSNRSMVAITHHREKGERFRHTVNAFGADQ